MTEGRVWEERSKLSFKNSINRRIRSIIGVSMEVIENNIEDKEKFEFVRGVVMKVCNDISRKLCEDLNSFTVKKNTYHYEMPFEGENHGVNY